jgi:hypothetical protein
LWNPGTAEVLWEMEQVFRNHDCVSPGFSPDGRYLGCYDGREEGRIYLVDSQSATPAVVERIALPSLHNVVSLAVDVGGRGTVGRLGVRRRRADAGVRARRRLGRK